MRYFTILDFQHWVAAWGVGLLLVILAYVSWAGYRSRSIRHIDLSDETMPRRPPESEKHPIAPILLFVYVGTLIWMVVYAYMVGVNGGAIK